ncbi:PAS domain-containing protein [Bailinhaonella thermotolerans]|uniref:protein-glutamate O-methyltransferase n=2 Tax=Bailinhaonella thermotolerans TaxID=1070861 RepID=A0A3A4AER3_9ACTN|nr:PAS domain-containing protein [Bailinhaonella thermotolerans]
MLKEMRGFDFTGYKRSTLQRRIARRMDALRCKTFEEYRDRLEVEPGEYALLFDSLLINVTGFFRDPPAWESLRDNVLPRLIAAKHPAQPIRVWSAGCATGQEAYSVAMLLADMLGLAEFRDRVKIYATDLDENALQEARVGVYTRRQLEGVPEEFRERYFEEDSDRCAFRRDLRRQVIFGRNDLTRDAPISRVDLLLARNTLMYFNAETQAEVIRRLHFALADPGYLFLGKAEMLLRHDAGFEPIDLRKRLFRKVSGPNQARAPRATWQQMTREETARPGALEHAVLAAGPIAQIAVDLNGALALTNAAAEEMFGLRRGDVGAPFQDLELSYRPAELRSLIEQVEKDRRVVELQDVPWRRSPADEPSVLDIQVVPLTDHTGALIGAGVSFTDVTRYRRLRDELEHANQELERAYEELQSLNEELETTNEELQSTNEELETTNEELQSTNEELETMNEELHSTNDELQEINEMMRLRTAELDMVNGFLASVLRSLGAGVVVVSRDLGIKVWTPGAEELWGVRAEECVGRTLPALDIGLPLGEVVPLLKRVLAAESPEAVRLEAVNRRGRPVLLRLDAWPLRGDGPVADGVILIMNVDDDTPNGPKNSTKGERS